MAAVTRARIPEEASSLCTVGLVGYDACFTRRRSRVRTSDCVCIGCVAQMAERRSNKPSVVGSSPTVTILFAVDDVQLAPVMMRVFPKTQVLWCNWLALWTLNPAIRVQIPVGPFCRLPTTPPIAKSGHGGDRTHDRRLIRPSLCHLSYATRSVEYTVRGSNSGPPACEAGVITN